MRPMAMDKESKHQLEQHVSDVLDLFTAGECEPRMFIAALVCSIARLAAASDDNAGVAAYLVQSAAMIADGTATEMVQ